MDSCPTDPLVDSLVVKGRTWVPVPGQPKQIHGTGPEVSNDQGVGASDRLGDGEEGFDSTASAADPSPRYHN